MKNNAADNYFTKKTGFANMFPISEMQTCGKTRVS